jgi:FtsP/CotA-like multicopper oxidase with cupredoxin domain
VIEPKPIRILVVDAHEGVRLGLRTALATADDMIVVADAASGRQALGLCRETPIDVALIDMRLPDLGSEQVIEQIRRDAPRVRIIALATELTANVRTSALSAGASGYLHKYVAVDGLIRVIRDVYAADVTGTGDRPIFNHEEDEMTHQDTIEQGQHTADEFSREIAGLPGIVAPQTIDLGDGDTVSLTAAPVRKRIGDTDVRMLAYNGSVPGPTLRVRQGSTVTVEFTNQTDLENTVHWHGLRLENRYDGTHATQAPVPAGGSFTYRVTFPDPGIYWYHPHIREDYGQEMGLYGNVIVEPDDSDYWSPVNRELAVTLDDLLIEDGQIAPFSRSITTYSAMGRFGNVMLANGEPDLTLGVERGEVVRFSLTNTANTRVFNVGFDGARMKLVGGDSGRVEHEAFVESVIVAPSERAIVEVLFDRPGRIAMEHRTPERRYTMATITVDEAAAEPSHAGSFETLRTAPEMVAARQRFAPWLAADPDRTLAFVAEMDLGTPAGEGPVVYTCPMHPEIVREEPGRCPICGMALMAQAAPIVKHTCPMHPEIVSEQPGSCPICGMKLLPADLVTAAGQDHSHHESHEHHAMHAQETHAHDHHSHAASDGIEWEDDMVAINRITTPTNTRWLLVDRDTGAANHGIDWQFRVGDKVKLRLENTMESDHPMHHPFHIHGAGRFLILSRDDVPEPNLVWKDTVLVRTGETVDLMLEVTNPGVWMAHCHIAEHHESGMMLHFTVTE